MHRQQTICGVDIEPEQIKKLKRRTIGLFGSKKTLSLDKIAQSLIDSNIVSSLDEGKKMVPELTREALSFEQDTFIYNTAYCLSFTDIGNKKYNVEAYSVFGYK